MVKQFTLGLCGLPKKSKLSLVSVNFMVLQVTSGSLREVGHILWNYCMLRIWGVVLRYPCAEHAGVSGILYLLSPLVMSCGDLLFGGCGNSESSVHWTVFTYLTYILHKNILLFTVWWSSKFIWGRTVPSMYSTSKEPSCLRWTWKTIIQ